MGRQSNGQQAQHTQHIKKSNQNGALNQMRIQIRPKAQTQTQTGAQTQRRREQQQQAANKPAISVRAASPHWDWGYKARTTASGAACRMTIRRLRRTHTHTPIHRCAHTHCCLTAVRLQSILSLLRLDAVSIYKLTLLLFGLSMKLPCCFF